MEYLVPPEKKIDKLLALLPRGVMMATELHDGENGQPAIVVKLSRAKGKTPSETLSETFATFKEPAGEFPSELLIAQIMLVV